MAFEIKAIDNFITECKASGNDITYDNFAPINESLSTDIQVPAEIFEAYLKYVDISGTEMVTILEFEKIKSFSEFINDRKEGDDSISTEDDEDDDSTEGGEGDSHDEPDADDAGAEGDGDSDDAGAEGDSAEGDSAEGEGEGDSAEGDAGAEGEGEGDAGAEGEGDAGTEGDSAEGEGEGDSAEGEDDEKKDDEDSMAIKVESVQTPPEKVAAQSAETKDDEKQQTKVDLETGDGKKTAASIESEINKMGEPEKKSDKEGEKLVGEGEVQTPPEKVAAQAAATKDDESQQTKVDLETGDGSKTAGKIEDAINKLGEPEKKSDAEGEKLLGESDEEKKNSEVNLLSESLTDEEYEILSMDEAEHIAESVLFYVNEGFGDTIKAIIGSPVKFIKIKNNLKDWAKAKLDIAAVEMDTIRKKEAAKEDPKGIDKDKLAAAAKSKKEAINGKMKAIEDRLKLLATTDSLRAVVSLGKTKASLEANKKLLKIANQEELDALKIKLEDQIEKDQESITNIEDKLKKYSKDSAADKDGESTSEKDNPESKDNSKGDNTISKKSGESTSKKDNPESKDNSKGDNTISKKSGESNTNKDSEKDSSVKNNADSKNFSKPKKQAIETIKRRKAANDELMKHAKEREVELADKVKVEAEAEQEFLKIKDSGDKDKVAAAEEKLRNARQESTIAKDNKKNAENSIRDNQQLINKLAKKYDIKISESYEIIDEGGSDIVNETENQSSVNKHLTNDIAARFRAAMRGMK